MIFFVASTKNQNLFTQVIRECSEKIIDQICKDNFYLLPYVTTNMQIIDNAEIFLVDLTACDDSRDDLLQALKNIRVMNDSIRIIVVDTTRYEGDSLLSECFASGIYDLIVTSDNVELKAELAFCITTGKKYKDAANFQEYVPFSEYEAKVNKKPDAEDVLIGLSGTHARIGVTHAMIVLANHLRKMGYLVALVDKSQKPTFRSIQDSFDCEDQNEYFTLDGIDYYKEQELQKLKKKGYNFILIDYGEYLERDESYGDCGIQIIIAGAKPWEVEKTFYVFQDTVEEKLKKYHYFFNFVADDLKDEVRSGMDNLKSVHFLTYAEDPFNSEDFPDIEDIIYEYSKPEPVPDKKKRKGFKKKG